MGLKDDPTDLTLFLADDEEKQENLDFLLIDEDLCNCPMDELLIRGKSLDEHGRCTVCGGR